MPAHYAVKVIVVKDLSVGGGNLRRVTEWNDNGALIGCTNDTRPVEGPTRRRTHR